jgi:hypothetical protein
VLVVAGTAAFITVQNHNPGCLASEPCTRVLFLGNSYTAVNDLPQTFADLSWSDHRRVEVGVQAPGGWTLGDQASAASTASLLAGSQWDFVVLQEQSEIPSVESMRQQLMYPPARDLVAMIRRAGAVPLFYLTWAHLDGWPDYGLTSYSAMQDAIDTGYLFIAGEQHAPVAPVGFAWSKLYLQESHADLWQGDGSHPTTKGTYLAACVFYAAIFKQPSAGLGYHPWLFNGDAVQAQQAADATVLGDLARWGLA